MLLRETPFVSRNENWKSRLQDMEDAAGRIIGYCDPLNSYQEFADDRKTFDACIRNLQILGDAAKKIPANIQKEHSAIPWRQMMGLRNVVVHEYFLTDPLIVWQTIKNSLPELLEKLKRLNARYSTPSHPWRLCPPGEVYVSNSEVDEHSRKGSIVREHARREHCRIVPGIQINIITKKEAVGWNFGTALLVQRLPLTQISSKL